MIARHGGITPSRDSELTGKMHNHLAVSRTPQVDDNWGRMEMMPSLIPSQYLRP